MKLHCLAIIILLMTMRTNAQTDSIAELLDRKLQEHFDQYMAETQRYNSLTTFGEKKDTFEKKQIDAELKLYEEIKRSNLIREPTIYVFDLCHNILIHSPEKGQEFLTLLNHPFSNKELQMPFFMEAIFTGEFGERLALKNLTSENKEWRMEWAGYLAAFAIYESSIPMIEKTLQISKDPEMQQDMIGALTFISSPRSIRPLQQVIENTKDDETQSKAIYAYTELTGYDGQRYLEQVKPLGPKAQEELHFSLDFIKKETSLKNKFGIKVNNDLNFILRFGGIQAPSLIWLQKEGLLDTAAASHPVALDRVKKNELLKVLIESKGFGLEAAKAQLFLSLDQLDIPDLLELRKSIVYSPNSFSFARLQTVGYCIRYLRKTKK